MSFYVRYFVTDEEDVALATLQAGLQEFDPAYALPHEDDEGEVRYADEAYAQIEINRPGDGAFDEELQETLDAVALSGGPRVQDVLEALRECRQIVALRILWQGRDAEQTLTRIDPVLVWLMLKHTGLLQVDGEGFYEGEELILEME